MAIVSNISLGKELKVGDTGSFHLEYQKPSIWDYNRFEAASNVESEFISCIASEFGHRGPGYHPDIAHFDIMFDGVDLAEIQTRHLIELLVKARWFDFQGFHGHSSLIGFAFRHRSLHVYNGMFFWVNARFGYSFATISGYGYTPGTLTHWPNNHHAPDTAEDLLAKPASCELALVDEVRDYGSLLSSAFMPEDCEDPSHDKELARMSLHLVAPIE